MQNYLTEKFDLEDKALVSALDELPLWSAPFGLMLLDHIDLKPRMSVLDVGCGLGFPLLELAQRLGPDAAVHGLDIWKQGLERIRAKIEVMGLKNVALTEGDAHHIPFPNNSFDLIVSNTGLNNFDHPQRVLEECFRVIRANGQIALTTNPIGHMVEFYDIYRQVLEEAERPDLLQKLDVQRCHRLGMDKIISMLQNAGFHLLATHHNKYMMRFTGATAFFNHFLIRIGFIDGWKSFLPQEMLEQVFTALEKRIDAVAARQGEFRVTVPIVYIAAEKELHKSSR